MYSNQTPTVSVSKVGSNRSIPLVENIPLGAFSLGIQYDTGCQLSLISQSALQVLSASMYSQGTSSRVRVMTYAGEGKVILTTEVKLKLHGKMLKFSAIGEDLNNSSGFFFPVPPKWRLFTGTSTSSHFGQISILLGGDNHLFFPTEVEGDLQGVALYQSNLTQSYLVYGLVPSNSITWKEPLISTTINTVFIKSLTIQDLQDQLLLTVSAEDFTDPTARGKLVQSPGLRQVPLQEEPRQTGRKLLQCHQENQGPVQQDL